MVEPDAPLALDRASNDISESATNYLRPSLRVGAWRRQWMADLLTILVFTLDPVRVFITLALLLFARTPWMVFVAAALSAVLCEALLMALQTTWVWGEGLVVGGAASLLQAIILFFAGSFVRNWRTNGSAPFLGQ